MPQDISRIGTATEKAFKKQEVPDFEKQSKDLDSPEDADKFNELLNKKNAQDNANAKTAQDNAGQQPDKPAVNAGDRILNAFQGMKDHVDTQRAKVDKLLTSDEIMGMKDMFRTQNAMNNLMLTQDLIGKVTGKTTQSIETLMKQQ